MSIKTKYYTEALSLKCITVPVFVGGKTLEEMGLTLNPAAHAISLQAVDGNIYVSDLNGNADLTSFVLLQGGALNLNVSLLAAKKLKFYASAETKMNVLQYGDI